MAWKHKRKPGPILIVEDDWDILEVLKLMLEEEGHAVVTAKYGREALAEANARSFDAVLMDISMPDMSGIDVAKALRANEKTRDIRIAIHTGMDEAWVRERFTDYDLFLTKAADTDVLVEKVGELMATARTRTDADAHTEADTDAADEALKPETMTFTIDDEVRTRHALRIASGAGVEPMSATGFVSALATDLARLKAKKMTEPDIAELIGRALGRPFPTALLTADPTP